jgi:adenosylcobinamide kinase/adenosylcobinamide-phosphate guanylyltransferase
MNIAESCLVTGGARSGKSRYALQMAANTRKPFYIATGWAGDQEMTDRIANHQRERGDHWTTIETKTELAAAIREAEAKDTDFMIVDCLTLWTSNILFVDKLDLQKKLGELIDAIKDCRKPLVLVTNEVGTGIVPADAMSREFRDEAGRVNQQVAAAVDKVFLCVCGIPMQIK